MALGSKQRIYELAKTLGLNGQTVVDALVYNRTQGRKMDAAQLNQLVTSTWAQKENIAMAKDDQRRQWEEFGWRKSTWAQQFNRDGKQWEAEFGLRQSQFKYGISQDQVGNAIRLLELAQSKENALMNFNAQDRATIANYASTLRSSVADARGESQFAAQQAQKLASENAAVQTAIANKAIYKGSDGVWAVKPGSQNTATQQYVDLMNRSAEQQRMGDQGASELDKIRTMILPGVSQDAGLDEMYKTIFGENGGVRMPTPGAVTPGAKITLTPAVRSSITSQAGKNAPLVTAILNSLDGGLVNPDTGQRIDDQDWRCSQALRIIMGQVGVDRAKYFGADARATWGLLKKNGNVLLGGKQLTEKDLANIPVGTILYQNTPATKDSNGKVVDYDHVAIYMGNGMVYQHNSDYASKTGASKGNLNVLSFGEFSKLFPTYGATIPEVQKNNVGGGKATPAAAPTGSGAKPGDGSWNPKLPVLAKGTY